MKPASSEALESTGRFGELGLIPSETSTMRGRLSSYWWMSWRRGGYIGEAGSWRQESVSDSMGQMRTMGEG
jgi:hypothetical protein